MGCGATEKCVVAMGPAQGSPCVFPFITGGMTYNECIEWTYGGDYQGQMWCSTKGDLLANGLILKIFFLIRTDTNGNHISNQGNYGFCPQTEVCGADICMVVAGPAKCSLCVFPFTWNGMTYNECTEWTYGGDNQGQLWCSTK